MPVGYTALHFACEGSTLGFHNAEVVSRLLEHQADIDPTEHNGSTPLHLACGSGITDTVQVLVEKGADVKRKNEDKKGVIELAQGYPSLQKWLVRAEEWGNQRGRKRRSESPARTLRRWCCCST